jgi:hypothetical protein
MTGFATHARIGGQAVSGGGTVPPLLLGSALIVAAEIGDML